MQGIRIAVLGALLALCGPCFAGDDPAPKPAVPSSHLVMAGAVWDPPEAPLVISLAEDGTISLLGKELGLEELRTTLHEQTRALRLRNPDGTSRVDAVLRVSPSLPWTLVQWVLQTCAAPTVQVSRIYFAVMPEAGGAEGVMPAFLPRDLAISVSVPSTGPRVRAAAFASEGAADRGAMFVALKAALDATSNKTVEIDAPGPQVPRAGHVIELVDLAYRAGAQWIEFAGAAQPFPKSKPAAGTPEPDPATAAGSVAWLRSWVKEKRKDVPNGVKVTVGGTVFEGAPGAAPATTALPLPPPRRARVPLDFQGELLQGRPDQEESVRPIDGEKGHKGSGLSAGLAPSDLHAREARRSGKSTIVPDVSANAAIEAALAWLAAHQSPDGSWEAAGFGKWCNGKPVAADAGDAPTIGAGKALYDVGTTGLALLAFLGAGYSQESAGPYGDAVTRGLQHLRSVQGAEGCFGARSSSHYVYCHAIATLSMVEAFGMAGGEVYKKSAQKGLDFVEMARNPGFAWRYGVKPGDNDMSVTGWMGHVLHVAAAVNATDVAAGRPPSLEIDDDAFEGVRASLDRMTDPATGRVGYQTRGSGPARPPEHADKFPTDRSESITAVGVFLRVVFGEDPATSAAVKSGAALLAALPPLWNPNDGSIDLYYWQAGGLAMAQVGGATADAWRGALSKALVGSQHADGETCRLKGSWDPIDPWGPDGGRVYMTAMAAMALEAPYRYPRVAAAAGKR